MRRKTAKGVVACEVIGEKLPQDESISDVISASSEEIVVDPTMATSTPESEISPSQTPQGGSSASVDLAMDTADTPESKTIVNSHSETAGEGLSSKKRPRKRKRGKRGSAKAAKRTKLINQ